MKSRQITRSFVMFLLSLLTLTVSSTPAGAQTAPATTYAFMVNTTNDTHDAKPGDGVCADSMGQCSLRAAIEEADALSSGSLITITVLAGTYWLTLGTLELTANTITINGAGRKTTIINGNKTFTVMSISPNVFVHLSQLTIEGGLANGSTIGDAYGGGIYNSGTLTMSDSTISGNSATGANGYGVGYGGGIYNSGTLTMSDSTISGNSANGGCAYCPDYGGGIYNSGTLSVGHSTLSSNSVGGSTISWSYGGAIFNGYAGTVSVGHSTLSGNLAGRDHTIGNSGFGGAIFNGGIYNGHAGTVRVSNSIFSGNSAYGGDYGLGGAIYNGYAFTLSVSHSTFSGNLVGGILSSWSYGGGIYNEVGTVRVSHSTFSGNSATGYLNGGGGIWNNRGKMRVSNSTFSGNLASAYNQDGYGTGGGIGNGNPLSMGTSTLNNNNSAYIDGGIEIGWGTVSVSDSTFSGNSARGDGGGIYNAGTMITLTGTIVANSPSGSNCYGTMTDSGYNLDSGTSCGFSLSSDLTNTDPMLGSLGHNGGPTKTMALLQGSKAIDWVATNSCPASDQRGHMRPDGSGESMCDIGAYESAY